MSRTGGRGSAPSAEAGASGLSARANWTYCAWWPKA